MEAKQDAKRNAYDTGFGSHISLSITTPIELDPPLTPRSPNPWVASPPLAFFSLLAQHKTKKLFPTIAAAPRRAGLSKLAAAPPGDRRLRRALRAPPLSRRHSPSIIPSVLQRWQQRRPATAVCFVVGQSRRSEITEETGILDAAAAEEEERRILLDRTAEKMARKQSERRTYLVAAVMSSLGITSMAVVAVYYRFYWQMEARSRRGWRWRGS